MLYIFFVHSFTVLMLQYESYPHAVINGRQIAMTSGLRIVGCLSSVYLRTRFTFALLIANLYLYTDSIMAKARR